MLLRGQQPQYTVVHRKGLKQNKVNVLTVLFDVMFQISEFILKSEKGSNMNKIAIWSWPSSNKYLLDLVFSRKLNRRILLPEFHDITSPQLVYPRNIICQSQLTVHSVSVLLCNHFITELGSRRRKFAKYHNAFSFFSNRKWVLHTTKHSEILTYQVRQECTYYATFLLSPIWKDTEDV